VTTRILEGVRVLDLAHHMAGPMATQKLGDMGADILKVEPPGGEWTRSKSYNDLHVGDANTSFLSLNRSKRSLVLDLKSSRGREIVYRLAESADVCILNYRPEAAMRLGVDYESIAKASPSIVYCSITGYGADGPAANRAGQDLLIQSYTGLPWNAGRRSDPPVPAGCFVADATTSYMATIGILAALFHRQRTGQGQRVEVDLLSSMMDVQIQELTTFFNSGWSPERSEFPLAHRMTNSPYGIHPTSDGFIALAMTPFDLLAEALSEPALRRFGWADGYQNRDEIARIVAAALLKRTTAEWIDIFDRHGVWSGPVNTYGDLVDDPNVAANGMITHDDDPERGEIAYLGFPIRFSATPASMARRPPRLGQDSDEILAEIGISPDEVEVLRRDGVI
jgi:crotonobetainyl-CoA:carnitine CoA-transferase CaiB-like acyl-CoA transferase